MLRVFKRIVNDIQNLKNIEAYATLLLTLIFAALLIIADDLPDNLATAVILAGIGLLVYKSTVPETSTTKLDDVLKDRQTYGKLSDFFHGGETLWIYGASAVNVVRNFSDIKREILDKGGSVRVLMQDPDREDSVNILYKQLDKIHDLRRDISEVVDTLGRVKEMKMRGELEYRFVPYSPGFSLLIIDPDGKDGRLVVEFYGYKNDLISDRMHIEIHRSQSQHWFEYWEQQFRLMWEDAETRQP